MRTIGIDSVSEAVCGAYIDACININEDVLHLFNEAIKTETSPLAAEIINKLVQNADSAKKNRLALCQDTGMAVCFVRIGQEVHLVGGSLEQGINKGIGWACEKGYLRGSMVEDPFRRINTKNNTPAIIHTELAEGHGLEVTVMPKGFGSENMSALKMLEPSDTAEAVVDFVCQAMSEAGSRPCPPCFVGVGVGGTADYCMLLSKKALLRDMRKRNDDPFYAELETRIIEKVNGLQIGVSGFGGNHTCLSAAVESAPTHIAGLPCAVSISCHALRRATISI